MKDFFEDIKDFFTSEEYKKSNKSFLIISVLWFVIFVFSVILMILEPSAANLSDLLKNASLTMLSILIYCENVENTILKEEIDIYNKIISSYEKTVTIYKKLLGADINSIEEYELNPSTPLNPLLIQFCLQ